MIKGSGLVESANVAELSGGISGEAFTLLCILAVHCSAQLIAESALLHLRWFSRFKHMSTKEPRKAFSSLAPS